MIIGIEEDTGLIVEREKSLKSKSAYKLRVEIGDLVKIKKIGEESEQAMEPEDYFYLKGFEKKIGTVSEQKESKSGSDSYRVEFDGDHFGYFYRNDFLLIREENESL